VTVDGRARELRTWSVIIGNGQFADGGLRLSPRSFPGDGVLDASIFTGPRSDAYRLLPRMFRHGDHIPDPGITELRARLSLQLEPAVPWPVVADGELIGRTPVAFQVVPRQILLKV
jgi:diacylglycerol kinase (ATP)